ncbi:MAG: ligand-binding sensor domain-containing protein, partial [Chitinophagaceae bacterium]
MFVSLMKLLTTILLLLTIFCAPAQFDHSFNRISKNDGIGLASNTIRCTYQDKRGFMWVGTANGLQRFDGNKFIWFSSSRPKQGTLPLTEINQIIPQSNKELWLYLKSFKKVGIFNTHNFKFTEVPIISKKSLPVSGEMKIHKDIYGNVFLFVWKYGVLKYDTARKVFTDDRLLQIPKNWFPSIFFHEDTVQKRLWMPCPDSGLIVYDYKTKKSYTSNYNPLKIPLLQIPSIQKNVWEFFIDSKRRHWVFNWKPNHQFNCFNEFGEALKDTAGLKANNGYAEIRYFFESKNKTLWMYGANALVTYNKYDNAAKHFDKERSARAKIDFRDINHVMEDADGIVWV